MGAGLDVDPARGGAQDADQVVLHAVLDRRHPRLLRRGRNEGDVAGIGDVTGMRGHGRDEGTGGCGRSGRCWRGRAGGAFARVEEGGAGRRRASARRVAGGGRRRAGRMSRHGPKGRTARGGREGRAGREPGLGAVLMRGRGEGAAGTAQRELRNSDPMRVPIESETFGGNQPEADEARMLRHQLTCRTKVTSRFEMM